jgi:hypothetical protein
LQQLRAQLFTPEEQLRIEAALALRSSSHPQHHIATLP